MASSRSVVVYENDGGALYNYVNSYLSSLTVNPEQPALFRASLIDDKTPLILGLQPGFPVRDKFQGLDFEWSAGVATDESRYVMAAFPPHCSNDVIQAYFSHLTTASKRRRLFTVRPPGMHEMSWASCEFDHPASLETLDCSMDAELKQELVKDLEAFAGARDYYRSIGKAWKRSYLVYGRQATGKDQLVAAIANKLGYDVYDLDTGLVGNKAQLKEIFMRTGRKAVVCVHGIDSPSPMTVKMADVLDVSDGLWAPDERIFVFVSDESKPDTVFPGCRGRIDFYVAMDTSGFQMLKRMVKLHLGVEDHRLLGEIKGLMMDREMEVDVGELLALVLGMNSGSNPDALLEKVAAHLKSKKPAFPARFGPSPSPLPPPTFGHPFGQSSGSGVGQAFGQSSGGFFGEGGGLSSGGLVGGRGGSSGGLFGGGGGSSGDQGAPATQASTPSVAFGVAASMAEVSPEEARAKFHDLNKHYGMTMDNLDANSPFYKSQSPKTQ